MSKPFIFYDRLIEVAGMLSLPRGIVCGRGEVGDGAVTSNFESTSYCGVCGVCCGDCAYRGDRDTQ